MFEQGSLQFSFALSPAASVAGDREGQMLQGLVGGGEDVGFYSEE